ncbi:MAG TPA: amino acid adenylation domain-containing protein [Polyangiales bacterium]|nr:amino acid adenylation domain-containing protein [Polyangiales bacterium]
MANQSNESEQATRASTTWVELMQRRAERMGERSAYTFLRDGEADEERVPYGELDQRSRELAVAMRDAGCEVGGRALLLVPAGPEFVRAFFACLYAGLVAVPVPLPSSKRGLPRVLGIVRDCRPSVVISTQRFVDEVRGSPVDPALAELPWIALESTHDAARYRRPAIDARSVAFLQYTSGSTGTPKGVMLTHENLLANQRAIASAFSHDEQSVVVGWLPPFHDMGLIGNVLQPMYLGIDGVHMAPQHFLADPLRWLRAVARYRGTTSGGPNFAYDLCVQKISRERRMELDLSSWKVAFNGAEPVRAETMERFTRAFAEAGFSGRAFYPCYGLAEATLLVSGGVAEREPTVRAVDARALEAGKVSSGDDAALIGCGFLRGLELAVVHPETRVRCGEGEVGELWLSGPSVAQGYWQRPDENAQTFGARTSDGAGPFLRTGDLGALHDGELFITGRLKDLILVRGRNLYPQDLEQAAIDAATTGGAAAFALEGDEHIVLVQEARGDLPQLARAIRKAIAERFEIALHAVVLIANGTLPRTTSGKVQRRATRARLLDGSLHVKWSDLGAAQTLAEPPRDGRERALAGIWEAVLGREPGSLGRDQEFVQLGGDSLQATQIAARIADELQITISGAQLFETTTIAGLANWVQDRPRAERASNVARERVPLSSAQQRLWFSEQLAAGEPAFHIAGAVRMRGPLDVDALRWSVEELKQRHPALRTRFVLDREGVQQVAVVGEPVPLPVIEAQGRSLAELAVEVIRRPFALDREDPARFLLVRLHADEHALVFVGHHLVLDGWSTARLVRDLRVFYDARREGTALPSPISGSYAEYACGAREPAPEVIAYWRAQFERPLAPLELPTDHARGALQSYRGARHVLALPDSLTAALSGFGREQGATPFMVFCAIYAGFLARLTGQNDLCVGTPLMARESARDEDVVGCYLDTLALRLDLTGDPDLRELVRRVKASSTAAQRNRALPFERVVELAGGARDLARSPLFQTMISMQPSQQLAGEDWQAEQLDTGSAQLELALDIVPERGGFRLVLEYSCALFEAPTIARLAQDYTLLAARWLGEPGAGLSTVPWLSRQELAALPVAQPFADEPVHVQFARHAALTPEREALVYGEQRLSYGELAARASQLAVGIDEPVVGVLLPRGPDLLVAILAVLKAGAAYVLIDPEQPAERTRFVLEDARVALVVSDRPVEGVRTLQLSEPRSGASPARVVHPEQLAYVLYTSGSTGRPKGVAVSHRALANTLSGWRARYGEVLDGVRVLSLASPAFDVFSADWVRALCNGGTLVLGAATLALDPRGMLATLRDEAITLVDLVPAQVEALLPLWPQEPLALRALIVGSDVWSLRTMRKLRALLPETCRLLSCYGVTEAAIDSACCELIPALGEQAVPLGEAFAGCALYVLDASGQVVPDGVAGELAIAGGGLARGYLGQPARTAERFVPDPRTPGARLYRTGDRVRRDQRGTLAFLGRLDAQVKVRGVRVELGEIEACLSALPGVSAACVAQQQGQLVAYLIATELDEAALRSALRERLPEPMQPSAYVQVQSFPLSANGKIDRRALPAFSLERRAQAAVAPRSALEQQLAAIWRELLPGREVGVHDNFFDLGGHSLLLAQVQSRLLEDLAREVPVLTMLQHPTIEALAAALEGTRAPERAPEGARARRAEVLARRRGGER